MENSHFSVGECSELIFYKGNCGEDRRPPEKWGKWEEIGYFVPFFLAFSSTTSRHNPPQPTLRVLCPLFPHFPPVPPPPISPHVPPFPSISPIFPDPKILLW